LIVNDKYTDNREILFDSLNWLPSNINFDVKLLTKGSDFLTYQENTTTYLNIFLFAKYNKYGSDTSFPNLRSLLPNTIIYNMY
jgi:hypothetical protein